MYKIIICNISLQYQEFICSLYWTTAIVDRMCLPRCMRRVLQLRQACNLMITYFWRNIILPARNLAAEYIVFIWVMIVSVRWSWRLSWRLSAKFKFAYFVISYIAMWFPLESYKMDVERLLESGIKVIQQGFREFIYFCWIHLYIRRHLRIINFTIFNITTYL